MNTTEYYYLDQDNQPRGPHTLEELRQMLSAGTLSADTLVAYMGAANWQPLSTICDGLPSIPPATGASPMAPTTPEKEHYSDSMGMFQIFSFVVFKNYLNFSGRATRREYWGFTLVNIIFTFAVGLVASLTIPLASNLYSIFIALPSIAVLFRRLHDVGRSGWWYCWAFVSLIPYMIAMGYLISGMMEIPQSLDHSQLTQEEYSALFDEQVLSLFMNNLPWLALSVLPGLIVGITVFIFTLKDSQRGTNPYGPSYKYPDHQEPTTSDDAPAR